jgi:protease-4
MHAAAALVHREVARRLVLRVVLGNLGPMKKSGCALLALFLALCASLFFNLVLLAFVGAAEADSLTVRGFRPGLDELVVEEGEPGAGKIAVIPVQGVIHTEDTTEWGTSMVDDIKGALRAALEDDRVKAIVLAVDSPGGEVTASDIIYNEVAKAQKEKPVVVAMSSLAASGAYYVSCAADWIVANPTTFTGSIGVIIQSLNYEGLLDKVGLDAVVFKSGKFKDMLSGSRPMTPEEKTYVEGMVRQVYERFLGIVAFSRSLEADNLRDSFADGRILTGQDAKEAGLVDQLGYIEDAYDKARALADAPDAGVIRYQSGLNFQRLLRLFGAGVQSKVEVQLAPGPKFQLQPGRAYLLPEFYAW